jgi:hypothetical protein
MAGAAAAAAATAAEDKEEQGTWFNPHSNSVRRELLYCLGCQVCWLAINCLQVTPNINGCSNARHTHVLQVQGMSLSTYLLLLALDVG